MTARALPDWPRMLRRPMAASYAGYARMIVARLASECET